VKSSKVPTTALDRILEIAAAVVARRAKAGGRP